MRLISDPQHSFAGHHTFPHPQCRSHPDDDPSETTLRNYVYDRSSPDERFTKVQKALQYSEIIPDNPQVTT